MFLNQVSQEGLTMEVPEVPPFHKWEVRSPWRTEMKQGWGSSGLWARALLSVAISPTPSQKRTNHLLQEASLDIRSKTEGGHKKVKVL